MSDRIDAKRARELLAAATPGPWYPGHNPDSADPLAYFAEAYSYGPPGRIHLACVPFEDRPLDETALFTAITGNGPKSEANAALIAAAPELAAAVIALTEERDAAVAERDELRALAETTSRGMHEMWTALAAARERIGALTALRDTWLQQCAGFAAEAQPGEEEFARAAAAAVKACARELSAALAETP